MASGWQECLQRKPLIGCVISCCQNGEPPISKGCHKSQEWGPGHCEICPDNWELETCLVKTRNKNKPFPFLVLSLTTKLFLLEMG